MAVLQFFRRIGQDNFQVDIRMAHAKYRIDKSYEWNYDNVPNAMKVVVPEFPGEWSIAGLSVDSPLGIAAGPLLNGAWVQYYASLGFCWLTYKTVRSSKRVCYSLPNLTPVNCAQIRGNERSLPVSERLADSWAVSFGMPSKAPDLWRRDISETRRALPRNKVLSVSVVGTMQPSWTIEDLADDYALCAKWAAESGADCVETNFSCPNVSSCDGQLYQNASDATLIAERVRANIGRTPYLVKIGHFAHDQSIQAAELLNAVAPFVDGVVTTNSIATTVEDEHGQLLFDGQRRGICGNAIREESVRQTKRLSDIINANGLDMELIGVGGIKDLRHVESYLSAGAQAVQLATAPMQDPAVGIKIRAAASRHRDDNLGQ